MPGVDVQLLLLRNPDIVLSGQRGAARLGPPAEEVHTASTGHAP